jgi:IS1 family transposase
MWANGMNWKHLSGQKNKIWVWTAVDHFPKGILAWTLGDHSAETFEPGQVTWQCYFYVTECIIILLKTYRLLVESFVL